MFSPRILSHTYTYTLPLSHTYTLTLLLFLFHQLFTLPRAFIHKPRKKKQINQRNKNVYNKTTLQEGATHTRNTRMAKDKSERTKQQRRRPSRFTYPSPDAADLQAVSARLLSQYNQPTHQPAPYHHAGRAALALAQEQWRTGSSFSQAKGEHAISGAGCQCQQINVRQQENALILHAKRAQRHCVTCTRVAVFSSVNRKSLSFTLGGKRNGGNTAHSTITTFATLTSA